MELYHNNMSVCAQKVRLVIYEKRLKPTEHHMMLRNGDVHTPEYLKLNPKGVVPTLIDHGVPIVESTVICEYLDEAYPENPLRPADPVSRAKMRPWTLLPDAGLHNACGALTVSIAWRHQMIANGRKQLDNRPNYNGQNAEMRIWIDEGIDGAHLAQAVQIWDETIGKISKALKNGPWLCGDKYTLADVAMLPYVCRLEDLGLAWFWEGEREQVGDWLERAKSRPNYSGIGAYYDREYVALATDKGREATPRLRDLVKHSRTSR